MTFKIALQCLTIGISSIFSILSMERPLSLGDAIKQGDRDAVRRALRSGALLDRQVLISSLVGSLSSDPEIVRLLLCNGIPASARCEPHSFNFTHSGKLITFNDDGSLVSKLISVYLISRRIYPTVVQDKLKILLMYGATIPAENDLVLSIIEGFFATKPLLLACIMGNCANVENTIATSAITDNEQEEALAIAVGQGHPKIVDVLLIRMLLNNKISATKVDELHANAKRILSHATPEAKQKYDIIRKMLEDIALLPRRLAQSLRISTQRH